VCPWGRGLGRDHAVARTACPWGRDLVVDVRSPCCPWGRTMIAMRES
jgi:hypothetical protein